MCTIFCHALKILPALIFLIAINSNRGVAPAVTSDDLNLLL